MFSGNRKLASIVFTIWPCGYKELTKTMWILIIILNNTAWPKLLEYILKFWSFIMIQRWDLIDNYIKHGYFDFVCEQIFGPEQAMHMLRWKLDCYSPYKIIRECEPLRTKSTKYKKTPLLASPHLSNALYRILSSVTHTGLHCFSCIYFARHSARHSHSTTVALTCCY